MISNALTHYVDTCAQRVRALRTVLQSDETFGLTRDDETAARGEYNGAYDVAYNNRAVRANDAIDTFVDVTFANAYVDGARNAMRIKHTED